MGYALMDSVRKKPEPVAWGVKGTHGLPPELTDSTARMEQAMAHGLRIFPLYHEQAIDELLEEIQSAKEEAFAALALLSRMRFACGDNGTRMQGELEEYLAGLRRDAERYAAVRSRAADLIAWTKSGNEVPADLPFVFRERWEKIVSDIRALEDAMAAERGEG